MKVVVTNRENGSRRVSFECSSKSLTEQSHKNECDINVIMKKYPLDRFAKDADLGSFVDVSEIADYQSALNVVINAQERFDSLPAGLRKRFSNSPAEFVDFCSDEQNFDELVKLGLASPKVVEVDASVDIQPEKAE